MIHNKLGCLALLSFFTHNCYTQNNGYKGLKIGSKLFDEKLIGSYKYEKYSSDSTLFRLESISPEFICSEKVEHLDVKMQADSSIDYIHLFTEEVIVKDVQDYFDKYKAITNCIINTVGKAVYYEDGNERSDGRMIMAWSFQGNTLLVLYTYSLSISEKNVKRQYKFVWLKTSQQKRMW